MKTTRILLMALGVLIAVIGVKYLLQEDLPDVFDALIWLAGGVVAHDAFLAPATLVVMVIATRILPDWLRGPVAVGFLLLATVTIAAVPVLGRFGARPDNPTLLDRNYVAGWLVFAAIVFVGVAVAAAYRYPRAAARVSA